MASRKIFIAVMSLWMQFIVKPTKHRLTETKNVNCIPNNTFTPMLNFLRCKLKKKPLTISILAMSNAMVNKKNERDFSKHHHVERMKNHNKLNSNKQTFDTNSWYLLFSLWNATTPSMLRAYPEYEPHLLNGYSKWTRKRKKTYSWSTATTSRAKKNVDWKP